MNPYMKKKSSTRMKMAGGGYATKRKMGMAKGGEAKKKDDEKYKNKSTLVKVLKPVNEVAKFVNRNITDKFLNNSGRKDSRQLAKEQYGRNRKRWKDEQIKKAGG